MDERIFPCIIILLNVLSSIVYFTKGDIRLTMYFFAAAVLNAAVTF